MIEQLRSLGDQLHAAWDTYHDQVHLTLQHYDQHIKAPHVHKISPEVTRQLDAELAFICSYETKIRHTKAVVCRARNYLSGVATINTLPPEIITRIFHLALEHPCDLHLRNASNSRGIHFDYPGYLQTCARWRKIAISSSSLWCHIDMSPHQRDYGKLLARTQTFLARARGLPIELHISGNKDRPVDPTAQGYNDVHELISRISDRVETLDLTVTKNTQGFIRTALRQLLVGQHSGFKKLAIRSEEYYDVFISPMDADSDADSDLGERGDGPASLRLEVTEEQIETSFASLAVVHLFGIFPSWSSAAYSQLVDLRLMSTSEWSHIKVGELAKILESSPALQILHFGLELTSHVDVTPITLKDLRVVKIFTEICTEIYPLPIRLLGLLAPGSKALRLSFNGRCMPGPILDPETLGFLARSRVERFYTQAFFPEMSIFLREATDLEHVIFDGFRAYEWNMATSAWLAVSGFASPSPHFGSLHINRSSLSTNLLRFLVKCYPNSIVLSSCDVLHEVGEDTFVRLTPEEVSEMFPTVQVIDHPSEDPIADWDVLD
ncbi:unnamed protein product [Rhizoctonia solani]|uniref:F-box domain-containing protein n=1 Tax=Rhizoctonia solani TaxID=456999 RepID=A0A8H2W7A2_9AGAM|nr:unnamed protein product [Rhizoctonia solani]